MGFSLGSVVNSAANISSRKTDKNKPSDSNLYEFLNTISNYGVQVKSNFEVEFLEMGGFQFLCQDITLPGLKSSTGEIFYKGRSIQIPIIAEQEHDFSMTVINDANGVIYTNLRDLMLADFQNRRVDNGFTITVKARSDMTNTAGFNMTIKGVRILEVSGLSFSHTDSGVSTFTVNCYGNTFMPAIGMIKKKEGLLDKVNGISNKISEVLGG